MISYECTFWRFNFRTNWKIARQNGSTCLEDWVEEKERVELGEVRRGRTRLCRAACRDASSYSAPRESPPKTRGNILSEEDKLLQPQLVSTITSLGLKNYGNFGVTAVFSVFAWAIHVKCWPLIGWTAIPIQTYNVILDLIKCQNFSQQLFVKIILKNFPKNKSKKLFSSLK